MHKDSSQAHTGALNPEHKASELHGKVSSLSPQQGITNNWLPTVPCGSSTERYDWLGA